MVKYPHYVSIGAMLRNLAAGVIGIRRDPKRNKIGRAVLSALWVEDP